MINYEWNLPEGATLIVGSQDAPNAILETTEMPVKRHAAKVLNIRLDQDTLDELLALRSMLGTRFKQSDIVRDAIHEKYLRTKKQLKSDENVT